MSNGVWKREAWLNNKVSIIACASFILIMTLLFLSTQTHCGVFNQDRLHKLTLILFSPEVKSSQCSI